MIAILGAICAYLLDLQRFVVDDDLLVTIVEWQGGPYKSWVPLYKPITYEYSHFNRHISSEIILFLMALGIGVWAWRNRNHKAEAVFARVVLGLCIATAIFFTMLWLARQHVEGDWTAVPPALLSSEVDTPEQLSKDAAFRAELQQMEYKRKGLTPTGEKIWRKVCILY